MDYHTRQKLARIAKVLDVLTIITMAYALFALLFFFAMMLFSFEGVYRAQVNALDFGGLSLHFVEHDGLKSLMPDKKVLDVKFYYEVAMNVTRVLLLLLCGWIARKMIKPLKEEKAFTRELSKWFRTLGIIVFVSSFVLAVTENLFYEYFYEAYGVFDAISVYESYGTGNALLLYSRYENPATWVGLSMGLFMWILSILFKHGEKLQVQSDETL